MFHDLAKTSGCLTEFQRKQLQKSLEDENLSKLHRQRICIMLLADEGKSQAEICQQVGCSSATARHWILVAESGMAHQWKKRAIGRPQTINDCYLERLKELVSQTPRDLGYPFHRWTGDWLSKHLEKEFRIKVSDRYINHLLKEMGLSTKPKPSKIDASSDSEPETRRIIIENLPSNAVLNADELWQIACFKLD
ncbi:helix-turn-helix domain-containing protein [Desmonostoc muscorum LEGE 12446]|uniref:Helix-turn-helix domain-containing protein n=2 Tax=Desmonostoc muscorum TaxID=1179 RepID=A0A8J6ZTH0_DESMC|nr:helix-turn-helix domain-containing protein [Desmonostoc muscorum LEGE 12446]